MLPQTSVLPPNSGTPPPNISSSPPPPSCSPQGESEGTQGPHGGNNRVLVTLSSDCLHKILPHKSLDGLQRLREPLKIAKKVQSDLSASVSFHSPSPSPLSKLVKSSLYSLFFCIFKNCCRIKSKSAFNFTFCGKGQNTHNEYCGKICFYHIWRTDTLIYSIWLF